MIRSSHFTEMSCQDMNRFLSFGMRSELFCEHDIEPSGSINVGRILGRMSDCQLLLRRVNGNNSTYDVSPMGSVVS
jgi:hypothetical protein